MALLKRSKLAVCLLNEDITKSFLASFPCDCSVSVPFRNYHLMPVITILHVN